MNFCAVMTMLNDNKIEFNNIDDIPSKYKFIICDNIVKFIDVVYDLDVYKITLQHVLSGRYIQQIGYYDVEYSSIVSVDIYNTVNHINGGLFWNEVFL